jgi:uncharacterized protein (UPF0332 family)
MVSTLYLERAENELELAKIIFKLTNEKKIQEDVFLVKHPLTFFSGVISHSYYCIFYTAKAYLIKKGIKTKPPEEHKKTFEEFKKLVEVGIIDVELLKIYEQVMVRADTLLQIFQMEKKKRGNFTYQKIQLWI